ncbi:MAG: deaD [Rhodocyclales bacterium]|nr:deaD [Rhodocyclales bacterium]
MKVLARPQTWCAFIYAGSYTMTKSTPDAPSSPPDIETFESLKLSAPLLTVLAEIGYETPSPIQAACIPHLLAGRDLLGEAQTGTGKTAAFALPLLERLNHASKKTQVLVLTPTRELAIQVAEAFQKYAKYLRDFHVVPIYGGQSMVVQLRQLSRGAQIIVGTPGRVMDHLNRKSLVLDDLKALVLDEADEMLRMGFIDDVEWILTHTPAERQTALFSATMPDVIRRVARTHMRDPQEIKIKSATSTVSTIKQRYWQVRGVSKLDALTRILEVEDSFEAAIVFVRTKTATVELADKLAARGYAADALNGDMTQGLRERVVEQLKSGALDIVVATDVAARGIDVSRVSHVINYDIPYDTEAYVHRIGRTGRAGRAGNAILFVAPRETGMLRAIERATRQPIEQIALPSREAVAEKRVSQFKQEVIDALDSEDMSFFMNVVQQLEEEQSISAQEIAAALAFLAQRERPLQLEGSDKPEVLQPRAPERGNERSNDRNERAPSGSFNERYSERTQSTGDSRPARDKAASGKAAVGKPVKSGGFIDPGYNEATRERQSFEKLPEEHREEILARRRAVADGVLQRYRIEVGRNHGVTPKEIVGAIANEGGIEGRQIGQINLFSDYSTVELPSNLPANTIERLQRTRVCQLQIKIRAVEPGEVDEKPQRAPRRDAATSTDTPRSPYRESGNSGGGDSRPPKRDVPPRKFGTEASDVAPAGGEAPPKRAFNDSRPPARDKQFSSARPGATKPAAPGKWKK